MTHEDIAKALSVNDEKVPVRIMRKVIPCLRITAYMKEAEFVGKKKSKLNFKSSEILCKKKKCFGLPTHSGAIGRKK